VSAEYTDESGMPLEYDSPPVWESFVEKAMEMSGLPEEMFDLCRPQWSR
jgi:hypothetical protein